MKPADARFVIKVFCIFLLSFAPHQIFAQAQCLSEGETQKTVGQINKNLPQSENPPLRREILDMQAAREKIERKIAGNFEKNQNLIPGALESNKNRFLRLCEIVRQNGWLTKEAIGEDGVAAALSIVRGGKLIEFQKQIFPVIEAAAKKGLIGNNQIAPLIDNLRVEQGLPQIFGTQTYIKNELFYLYPLFSDAKVDDYRKLYGLPPLSAFMKYLLFEYGMPVIKTPRQPSLAQPNNDKKNSAADLTAAPLPDSDKDEIVKVESSLVNLNVRVFNGGAAADNLNLQKSDFALFENGKPQEISFFSAADTPFDLVLLLDLSGSTAGKKDLIRKSTERFIQAARPSDRIAIVTFTDEVRIVADLTNDREELLKKVKKINDYGGSNVWFGIETVFERIIKPESQGRRSAVMVMTDGVDSGLLPRHGTPDYLPNFSDVLETVRGGETTVIPIYLDTETLSDGDSQKAYRVARQTLSMLAEESGGQMYYARKIDDLTGVYGQIIKDLSRVYSLGFEPSEISRDGSWHSLSVKISTHPELEIHTKKGYYAK